MNWIELNQIPSQKYFIKVCVQIGADKSKEMVLFAEKECKTSKVSYVNFDIEETDKDKVKDIFSAKGVDQGFDKIFSFHCLHWIKNSRYVSFQKSNLKKLNLNFTYENKDRFDLIILIVFIIILIIVFNNITL